MDMEDTGRKLAIRHNEIDYYTLRAALTSGAPRDFRQSWSCTFRLHYIPNIRQRILKSDTGDLQKRTLLLS